MVECNGQLLWKCCYVILKKRLMYKCLSVLNELKRKWYPGVVACASHHNTWEAETGFEASLIYVVTSRPARNAQQGPVST